MTPGIDRLEFHALTPDVESPHWLSEGRVPAVGVTLVTAPPGDGKSTFLGLLMASVTRGYTANGPGGVISTVPARVVMLQADESFGQDVRPRLDRFGADVTKVFALTGVFEGDGVTRPVRLETDCPLLEESVAAYGDVGLITVDPLEAFVRGWGSSFRVVTSEGLAVKTVVTPTAPWLGRLASLARRRGLAVVIAACNRPVTKGGR